MQTSFAPFVRQGLPADHFLLKKLWRISRVLGNISPFSDTVLNHTETQMDFILESYALDNPGDFKFVRSGEEEPLEDHEQKAALEGVLIGRAREDFLKNLLPPKAVLEKAAAMTQAHAMLKTAADKQKG